MRVESPYDIDNGSTQNNLDNMGKFKKSSSGWEADGRKALNGNNDSITFTIYENVPQSGSDSQKHDRNADRWDITIAGR